MDGWTRLCVIPARPLHPLILCVCVLTDFDERINLSIGTGTAMLCWWCLADNVAAATTTSGAPTTIHQMYTDSNNNDFERYSSQLCGALSIFRYVHVHIHLNIIVISLGGSLSVCPNIFVAVVASARSLDRSITHNYYYGQRRKRQKFTATH